MTVNIENEYVTEFDFDVNKTITDVVSESVEYVNCPYEITVNVLLTDDLTIKNINSEHRNIDKATDVLSFPMIEYEIPGNFDFIDNDDSYDYFEPDTGELILGDIIISCDKVIEQSKEYGHSQRRELAFLVAHSMFHLFGYDHMTEIDAREMEAKQEDVLKKLKITRNGD